MAEINKSYEPGEVEKRWYGAWQAAGAPRGIHRHYARLALVDFPNNKTTDCRVHSPPFAGGSVVSAGAASAGPASAGGTAV